MLKLNIYIDYNNSITNYQLLNYFYNSCKKINKNDKRINKNDKELVSFRQTIFKKQQDYK